MADVQLSAQDTLTEAELDSAIIAVQAGTSKVWRKVTPAELLTLLDVSTDDESTTTTTGSQGQLIATITLPTGTITSSALHAWTLSSGIPSGISLAVFSGTDDVSLVIPKKRVADEQRGWLFAIVVNDVVEAECTFDIGNVLYFGGCCINK